MLGIGVYMTILGHSSGSAFESWTGGWLCGLIVAEIVVELTLRKKNVRTPK